MKRQFQGIALILLSILLCLAYGNEAVFDFSIKWHTVFVLIGIGGTILTFIKPTNDKK